MTTARRLALRFGAMALATLCLQGAVSVWLTFRTLRADAAHDAEVLGRLAAGLMEPALASGNIGAALERLSAAQLGQESARFAWWWLDESAGRRLDETTVDAHEVAELKRGQAVTILHGAGHHAHVLALVPVQVGARTGVVQVDDDISLQASHVVRIGLVVLALIALLATAFVVVGDRMGNSMVGKPVQRLIALTQAVGAGDLTPRVEPSGGDELGRLGIALNHMVGLLQQSQRALQDETRARLDAAERLRHADRLVTVGRLSAGIAHELGTPLNIVLLRAQLISGLGEDLATKHASVIEAQVGNMERIVKQLLGFARKNASTPSAVDVGAVVQGVREMLLPTAQARMSRIQFEGRAGPAAQVDRQSLEQVLSNLVMNSLQAMPPGGVVSLSCKETTRARHPLEAERPWVCVEVSDVGPGLPPQVRERLFEPFVTTKPVGVGTGLGLSVAWGLAQEWGGWIEVSPPEDAGCRFSCYLPPPRSRPGRPRADQLAPPLSPRGLAERPSRHHQGAEEDGGAVGGAHRGPGGESQASVAGEPSSASRGPWREERT